MEQALINKMKEGTVDDIDAEMIAARCKVAHFKLLDLIKDFTEKYEAMVNEYEAELKIGKCTLVMAYTDGVTRTMGKSSIVTIVSGHVPYAQDLITNLEKEVLK